MLFDANSDSDTDSSTSQEYETVTVVYRADRIVLEVTFDTSAVEREAQYFAYFTSLLLEVDAYFTRSPTHFPTDNPSDIPTLFPTPSPIVE